MTNTDLVDRADRYSRKRALIAILAAVAFLGVQFLGQPRVFRTAVPGLEGRIDWWAINALVLLVILATGGGLLNSRQIRALLQDELARTHLQTAVRVGFWVAMGIAFGLYFAPWFRLYTAQQAVYLIVTGSVVVSLLTFAGLERRAQQDG